MRKVAARRPLRRTARLGLVVPTLASVALLAGCGATSTGAQDAGSARTTAPSSSTSDPAGSSPQTSASSSAGTPSSAAPSATPVPSQVHLAPVPDAKPLIKSSSSTTTPSPTPGPDASPTSPGASPTSPGASATSPAPETTPPAGDASIATGKALARGDAGPQVLAVQQRLQQLGYWIGTPNGTYGPVTQQAVWALQKAAGLVRDGAVGPDTRKALAQGVVPHARVGGGKHIEVDLQRQLALLVDGGKTIVINASTGNGEKFTALGKQYDATTPTGTFHIYYQQNGQHSSTLEIGNMWRPKYFNGGIALHGEGFLVPPYPASHGCVRISDPAMNWVWDTWNAPLGTQVTVY